MNRTVALIDVLRLKPGWRINRLHLADISMVVALYGEKSPSGFHLKLIRSRRGPRGSQAEEGRQVIPCAGRESQWPRYLQGQNAPIREEDPRWITHKSISVHQN
jgi:hypothetical protein